MSVDKNDLIHVNWFAEQRLRDKILYMLVVCDKYELFDTEKKVFKLRKEM